MNNFIGQINALIAWGKDNVEDFKENQLSDGYHTFNELYEFRKVYNVCLFNEWASLWYHSQTGSGGAAIKKAKYDVHKSWRHNDGQECFPESEHRWFIVSAMLPTGLISNHYKESDWELFKIPEVDKALYPFDGHTGKDVMQRLLNINKE